LLTGRVTRLTARDFACFPEWQLGHSNTAGQHCGWGLPLTQEWKPVTWYDSGSGTSVFSNNFSRKNHQEEKDLEEGND
jgi:hypothetical protein